MELKLFQPTTISAYWLVASDIIMRQNSLTVGMIVENEIPGIFLSAPGLLILTSANFQQLFNNHNDHDNILCVIHIMHDTKF